MIRDKMFTPGDKFDSTKYPELKHELNQIYAALCLLPEDNKSDIIISYYKHRRIKTEFLATRSTVVQMVLSGSLSTYQMEELFASCKDNPSFLEGLEQFIHEVLTTSTDQSITIDNGKGSCYH